MVGMLTISSFATKSKLLESGSHRGSGDYRAALSAMTKQCVSMRRDTSARIMPSSGAHLFGSGTNGKTL
jgi:hypothetical protein